MTTLVRRCTIALPVLFWQLVNLSVFGYAIAFLFFPTDASKLFLVAPDIELVRFLGVQYLLVSAGANQMLAYRVGGSSALQKSSYATSLFEYLLGGIAGIVVLTMKTEPFIEWQRIVFIVLFSLFTAAIFLGFCFNCGGFCSFGTTSSKPEMSAVVTEVCQLAELPFLVAAPNWRVVHVKQCKLTALHSQFFSEKN